MISSVRFGLVIASLTLLGSGSVWAAPQTADQQKCINAMNKNGLKLHEAQCTDNRACVKDFGQGRLGALTGDDCLDADRLGKIAKRRAKTLAHESLFCVGGGVPDFGYTSGTNVNTVARQAGLDLMHDLFGDPVDNGLVTCDPFVDKCVCQRFMSKWIHKLFATTPRVFRKCKKAALKVGKDPFFTGAASSADLEACWDDALILQSVAADPNAQLGKIITNLTNDLTDRCDTPGVTLTAVGPCAGLTGTSARDCVINRVQCRSCLMINAMDSLAIDCDTFDDGLANASCP